MTPKKQMRLHSQVLLWILPVMLLGLLVIGGIMVHLNHKALMMESRAWLDDMADRSRDLLNVRLNHIREQVRTLAANDLVTDGLIHPDKRHRYLPVLFRTLTAPEGRQGFARFSLLDLMGQEIVSNNVNPGPTVLGLGLAHELSEGREIFRLGPDGLLFAAPVSVQNLPQGAVSLSLPPQALASLSSVWNQLDHGVALVDDGNRIIASNIFYKNHAGSLNIDGSSLWLTVRRNLSEKADTCPDLIVGLPLYMIRERLDEHNRHMYSLFLIITLSVTASVILAARMTARPVEKLGRDILNISQMRKLSARLSSQGPFEIQQLADIFNRTMVSLEETHTSRMRLDQLISSSPVVIFTADPRSHAFSFVSTNVHTLLGFTNSDILSDPAWLLTLIHPEDRAVALSAMETWMANGARGILKSAYRLKKPDGSWVWVKDHRQLLGHPDDTDREVIGYLEDISERKAAEDALTEKTFELENFFNDRKFVFSRYCWCG